MLIIILFPRGFRRSGLERTSLCPMVIETTAGRGRGGTILTQVAQWAESAFLGTESRVSAADMRPLFSVSLRNLLPQASFIGCGDLRVLDVACSSHQVTAGGLFAALPGTTRHGREFVADAMDRGASAVLTDLPLVHCSLPQCVVANPRAAYAQLCHALYGNPTRHLGVIGVTGTNGKTTTTWMIRSILEAARGACGLLGTIECSDGIGRAPSTLTTPESRSLAQFLAATHSHGPYLVASQARRNTGSQCGRLSGSCTAGKGHNSGIDLWTSG